MKKTGLKPMLKARIIWGRALEKDAPVFTAAQTHTRGKHFGLFIHVVQINRPSWYLAFVLKIMLTYCAFTGDAVPYRAGTVANAANELEGITLEFFSASKDASLH